jgi:histidinol-phosphate aminotransferase
MLDFAVNVRQGEPPPWLVETLTSRLRRLARYPSADDVRRATQAVADRHGRRPDEVALLAGGAEGFALLANLRPRLVALLASSFTESEAVLDAAGVPTCHVVLEPPFVLDGAEVPEDADLVELGDPTNDADARRLAALRADMVAGFRAAGVDVVDGRAPYLLFRVPDADLVRKHLDAKGIAVRRCDTFVGLDGQYLCAAVRQEWPALLEAIDEAIR